MVIKIKDEHIDLSKADRDRLIELKAAIDSEVIDIDLQLEQYKMKYQTAGESGDYNWFISARQARMIKKKQLIAVNLELTKRPKKRKKIEGVRSQNDYFADVAKEFLSRDDFNRFVKLAQDRMIADE